MNRREFIGGAAAFCAAHSDALQIGRRVGALPSGGGGGISAKSYVQDGLVAMWDGIENAGWGVHDANATTWKDLIGSHDLTYNSDRSLVTIGDDAVITTVNRKGAAYRTDNLIQGGFFCEICFNYSVFRTSGCRFFSYNFGNGERWNQACLLLNSPNVILCGGSLTTGASFDFPSASMAGSLHTLSAEWVFPGNNYSVVSHAYIDAEEQITKSGWFSSESYVTVAGSGQGDWSSPGGKTHSLRIYNRGLSTSEIAANHAVDMARFMPQTS